MHATLPAGEAHLYHARTGAVAGPAHRARCAAVMSPGEHEQMARLLRAEDRHRFLVTRALVRDLLSRHAPIAPSAWTFGSNAWGRPEISGPDGAPPLSFSVSHTTGLVACLLSREREAGVDVEDTGGPVDPLEVSGRFFAASEHAALCRLSPAAQRRRFFSLWTLKESYIKARGMGLEIPLDQVAFDLDDGAPGLAVALDPRLHDEASRWRFVQLELPGGHLAAVALCRPLVLHVHATVPLYSAPHDDP